MARKRNAIAPAVEVTSARAARLHQLVVLLRSGPQTRPFLCKKLGLDVRTFYRDLDLLRSWIESSPTFSMREKLSTSVQVRVMLRIYSAKRGSMSLPLMWRIFMDRGLWKQQSMTEKQYHSPKIPLIRRYS